MRARVRACEGVVLVGEGAAGAQLLLRVGHAALYSGKDVSVRCHRDLDIHAGIPFSSSHSPQEGCKPAPKRARMLVVVEATLSAMCGWQGPTTPAVHRHCVALQQVSTGHRIHQVRMSSKRKAKPAEAASEAVVVDEAIQNILDDERCNVCLTHVNADFDSLAGTRHQFKMSPPPPSPPQSHHPSRSEALPQATCRLCPLTDPMGWGGVAGRGREGPGG